MKYLFALISVVAALCLPGTVVAQEPYPSRPIHLIVPFPPGAGGDFLARALANGMATELKQPVVIENKPGANGVIGAMETLKRPADGYTLFYGSTTTLSANPHLMKNLPYDPGKDFAGITVVADIQFLLVVNASKSINTVADLVSWAKQSSHPLRVATSNASGVIASALLSSVSNVQFLNIPYQSTPTALTDLIGDRVDFIVVDVGTSLPLIKAGKLRAIGVTTPKRSTLIPNVPTVAETFPGYEYVGWNGLMAAAKTPIAILNRLNAEAVKVLHRPEVKDRFAQGGFEVRTNTSPKETTAFFDADRARWAELVKLAGLKAE